MKGKILLSLLIVALAIATPMRTSVDAGQRPPSTEPVATIVVKPQKKRWYQTVTMPQREKRIAAYVRTLNNTVDAKSIARAIVKAAQGIRLEPEIYTAMLAHESGGFKTGLVTCYVRNEIEMCDHGISQLNDYYWAGVFDFERARHDAVYAIHSGAKVLEGLRKQHKHRLGESWWTAYNSANPTPRKKYERTVNTRLSQFKDTVYALKM